MRSRIAALDVIRNAARGRRGRAELAADRVPVGLPEDRDTTVCHERCHDPARCTGTGCFVTAQVTQVAPVLAALNGRAWWLFTPEGPGVLRAATAVAAAQREGTQRSGAQRLNVERSRARALEPRTSVLDPVGLYLERTSRKKGT